MNARIQSGFTMVELMIVTAIIGIVAGISVPNLVSSRLPANESAVVGALRAIASAELQFHAASAVDANGDGAPEYATVGEMTGAQPLRDSNAPLTPPLLSTAFQVDAQGRITKSGYYIQVFTPDAGGVGLVETPANLPNIDAPMANVYWTAVAWPISRGNSGKAAFFVNQQGQILKSTTATYSGTTAPPAGAGLVGVPATRIDSQSLAIGVAGADGNNWVVLR